MSFVRERVAPVVAKPPPGRYQAPLKITFHTDTPNALVLFTLDGTMPVENSDREHGFRCEHYHPSFGYTLKSGGTYTLTVVAHRRGMVSTTAHKFTYKLDGDVIVRKTPTLSERIVERRFHAMAELDPPMTVRMARRHEKNMSCMLADTCPKAVLEEKLAHHEPFTLFRLVYDSRVVSRCDKYRRVVAPSMTMNMPHIPKELNKDPTISLRTSAQRALTPSVYERPASLPAVSVSDSLLDLTSTSMPRDISMLDMTTSTRPKTSGALVPITTTVGIPAAGTGSRAATALTQTRSPQHRRPDAHSPQSTASRARTQVDPIDALEAKVVKIQLSSFELRNTGALGGDDLYDDPEERKEEDKHKAENEATLKIDFERKKSKTGASLKLRRVAPAAAANNSSDVAASDRDPIQSILVAQSFCHNEVVKQLLGLVPVATIVQTLGQQEWFTVSDIVTLCKGKMAPFDVASGLRPILDPPPSGPRYPVRLFLLVCKFIIWVARPIPEAVFGLVATMWRSDAQRTGQDPAVGKLSLLSTIEAYRRTRGSDPAALRALYLGMGELPWSQEGQVPSSAFFEFLRAKVATVDAALLIMNNALDPMYSSPLELWKEFSH